jgi:hypothetical protein
MKIPPVKFKFIDWLDDTIKTAKSKYSLRTSPFARRCYALVLLFAKRSQSNLHSLADEQARRLASLDYMDGRVFTN